MPCARHTVAHQEALLAAARTARGRATPSRGLELWPGAGRGDARRGAMGGELGLDVARVAPGRSWPLIEPIASMTSSVIARSSAAFW